MLKDLLLPRATIPAAAQYKILATIPLPFTLPNLENVLHDYLPPRLDDVRGRYARALIEHWIQMGEIEAVPGRGITQYQIRRVA